MDFKYQNLNATSSILQYMALLFYIFFFVTSGSYKLGLYGVGDGLGVSQYLYTLFEASLSGAIILSLYLRIKHLPDIGFISYIRGFGFLTLSLTGWHLLFSIYVGDRGPIIYFLSMVLLLYFIRNRKVNFRNLILGIPVVLVALNFLGDYRSRTFELSFSERVIQSFEGLGNSVFFSENIGMFYPTMELATSGRTLTHSIAHVPREFDHTSGSFQLQAILGAVPGVSGIYNKLVHSSDERYDGSANFVSNIIQFGNVQYGDGTSMLADLYIDFGFVGSIIGMCMFGFLIYFVDIRLYSSGSPGIYAFIFAMVFLSGSIYIARSTPLFYVQKVAMIYVLVISANSLSKVLKR